MFIKLTNFTVLCYRNYLARIKKKYMDIRKFSELINEKITFTVHMKNGEFITTSILGEKPNYYTKNGNGYYIRLNTSNGESEEVNIADVDYVE